MRQRLAAANKPSLFVMGYDRAAHRVFDLIVVPRHFFTEAVVRPRPPLGPNARRAGWQGCVIRLKDVPAAGRIPLIRHGAPRRQAEVRAAWAATLFLRDTGQEAHGWLLAVMQAVEASPPPPAAPTSPWPSSTPANPTSPPASPPTATSARRCASSCRC